LTSQQNYRTIHYMKNAYLFHRITFDPSKKDHRLLFSKFLDSASWRPNCPFILEEPYGDIVSMCLNKTARYYLEKDKSLVEARESIDA